MKDTAGRKVKVEFSLSTIQNNTSTRKQLEGFIEEVVMAKGKIKLEQEALKDIYSEAKDSLGIPRKILNKLVKENMDPGSIEAEAREIEEVQGIADAIESSHAQFSSTTQP